MSTDVSPAPSLSFQSLYTHMSLIQDALMKGAAQKDRILRNPVFGDLLGSLAEISNQAAQMNVKLEGIRRDFPELWELWQQAAASAVEIPPR